MKSFITAVVEHEADETGQPLTYEFEVDGEKCIAKRPKAGQLGVLIAMISAENGWQTQTAGIINFFLKIMDQPTRVYFAQRLQDFSDDFDLPEVENILVHLVEEWTGNPTVEPSGSTSSPRPTGKRSTQSTRH